MQSLKLFAFCLAIFGLISPSQAQQKKNQKRPGRAVLEIPEVEKKDIICFALYTVHDKTLKLTAQLYPLGDDDDKTVAC
ncbi:MAG: hypothetical protein AAF483_20140, partial [Planctomycetota bacterium]